MVNPPMSKPCEFMASLRGKKQSIKSINVLFWLNEKYHNMYQIIEHVIWLC